MSRIARLAWSYRPLALWAGGLMWLIWLVSCWLGPGNLDRTGQVIGTDHTAFHTAAVLLAEGRGEALYDFPDLPEFSRRQEEITGKNGFLDAFRNPPFYALLYLPTAGLPYLVSYGVWACISLLSLGIGLTLVGAPRPALAWSLSFFPVFAAVSFGQNTLLSLGVFAVVYRLVVSDRRFAAGLCAGLLLFKPQLLLGLGLWWLLDLRRSWPCLAGLVTTAGMLGLLSLLAVPDETVEWVRRFPEIARYDAFAFFNLHNPRGFGTLLTGSKTFGNGFGLLGLVLATGWFWHVWRRHRGDTPVVFAAAVLVTLWGSPHTMTYEWALAVVPAVLLWQHRPAFRPTWTVLFAISWAVLFVSTPLTKIQLDAFGLAVQLSIPVLAGVGLGIERALRMGS